MNIGTNLSIKQIVKKDFKQSPRYPQPTKVFSECSRKYNKMVIDLRPNRDLIHPDFSGYKLDLTSLPTYERSLEKDVDTIQAGDAQFSYAHTSLFSLHNHLHWSPFLSDLAFYVDETWTIVEVSVGAHNRVQSFAKVLEIPKIRPRRSGDFPISIAFASANRAIINDGAGNFHVAAVKRGKWLIVYSGDNIAESSVVSEALQDDNRLFILMRSIEEQHFQTVLDLLIMNENWQTLATKNIKISGVVYYVAFQSSSSLLIISQLTPKYIEGPNSSNTESLYKWTQTAEDVTVIVDAVAVVDSDITVDVENGRIRLVVKGNEIVNGELFRGVSPPTWSLESEKLQVTLRKADEGVAWKEFVIGDVRGVQVQTYREEEPYDVPVNTEELEEVDSVAPAALFRFRVDTGSISHEADLSQSQYLFSVVLDPGKPAALCLKSSIDGCIWHFEEDVDLNLKANHLGTFSAFGYVQASKTQRKFISSPADLSYVAICDAFRHIYIFRQPSPVDGTLRNRNSGTRVKAIAKQHLLNIENSEEILGVRSSNTHLMILTKTKFLLAVINQ